MDRHPGLYRYCRDKNPAKSPIALLKETASAGVFNIRDLPDRDQLLESIDIEDIWGIGRRYALRLRAHGISNARELRDADEYWIQKQMAMGIVGVRILHELRGIPCIPLELCPPAKKGITSSRSFANPVLTISNLREAVATFVSRAAEKLRSQHSLTQNLSVYIMTNPFGKEAQYYNSTTINLPVATASTPELIRYAWQGLQTIYRPGYHYKKAGILMTAIVPDKAIQSCFFDTELRARDIQLMRTIDQINTRMGADTVQIAAVGLQPGWRMRRHYCSPAYTTRWSDLKKCTA